MSIRLRLTLLYSAILALTLVVFSSVLYATQAQYTMKAIENDLLASANRIVPMLFVGELGRERTHPLPWMNRGLEMRDLRTRDTVRLLDVDGEPLDLAVNEGTEDLPLSHEGLEQLRSGAPWVEVTRGEEGRVLTYSLPVIGSGETIAIVQIGRSLADRDRALYALGVTLVLGSALTTVVAFGIGWVLAGVTLRPIQRITQAAREIGRTRDFGSRVPYRGPNDELGRLAKTFNGMLSQLERAFQKTAHALQVQRDFVADVSHELRTPLTTIRGNLALLQREPPVAPAERREILGDLSGESERLIRLVTDLLTLARADAGRKLACEPTAITPLVDDACRQARLLKPELEIACDGPDDVVAMADPDALKQVLLILLDNAIHHATGPVHVVLGEENGRATVSVQDSGPGMPAELCERVFDRFYRGDESRSTPGFGLGLSIAQALVEAQGGAIAVESQVGTGSTFTVELPKPAES